MSFASTTNRPRVSVVTPAYNAERYIEGAVRSVLAQTLTDFEYIIVNDGSVDGTADILDRLATEDARLRVIHLEKNQGNARANNHGFLAARGAYIACMDADDLCHPERLEKQVAYLDTHKDIGLVATQYTKIDENGAVVRKARNRLDDLLLRFHLLFGVPVCNPTTTFRRALVERFAPEIYNANYVAAADYEFLVRVAACTKMHVVPEYLFYYRVHANGLSKSRRDTLIHETVPMAMDHMDNVLGKPTPEDRALLEGFLRLQLDQREPMTADTLGMYVAGMRRLVSLFVRDLSIRDTLRVKMFAFEVEAKTLLGRFGLRKKPRLLLTWIRARLAG